MREREKKQHTVNDYILVVLSLKRIQTQTHTQDQRKCEKTTNWAEKLVWEIGKSSNLAALQFVWICAFSDDASFYEWRGRADFEKYGSHHHLPIHLDLNLYLNSYLPICLSTQFSKCQFQSSQAKLSTSTMSTNHCDNDVDTFAFCYTRLRLYNLIRIYSSSPLIPSRCRSFSQSFCIHYHLDTFSQITFPLRFSARANFSLFYNNMSVECLWKRTNVYIRFGG